MKVFRPLLYFFPKATNDISVVIDMYSPLNVYLNPYAALLVMKLVASMIYRDDSGLSLYYFIATRTNTARQ